MQYLLLLEKVNEIDLLAPQTRSAAAGEKTRPLGRGDFTECSDFRDVCRF
jgi:hypothetical protein